MAAIVELFFGILLLAVPQQLMENYATDTSLLNGTTVFLGRIYGSFLLGLGVVLWMFRDAPLSLARRAALLGFAVISVIQLVLYIGDITGGNTNELGWSSVILIALFGVGYVYYFMQDNKAIQERAGKPVPS